MEQPAKGYKENFYPRLTHSRRFSERLRMSAGSIPARTTKTIKAMDKLTKTIAHALGYYMYARINGQDGEAQLKRLKRLQEIHQKRE